MAMIRSLLPTVFGAFCLAQAAYGAYNGPELKIPMEPGGPILCTVEAGGGVAPQLGGGTDSFHTGDDYYSLDFDDRYDGDPVIAAAAGRVAATRNEDCYHDGPSCYVTIEHGAGYTTRYLHLRERSLEVSVNECVSQGKRLGVIGNTGQSEGSHLHFELKHNGDGKMTNSALEGVTLDAIRFVDYVAGKYYTSGNEGGCETTGAAWKAWPLPTWTGSFGGPMDAQERAWHDPDFDDSLWECLQGLPDNDTFGNKLGDRFYRIVLDLTAAEVLEPILVSFASDDGLWLYVNGSLAGHWGDDWRGRGGCVNDPTGRCRVNTPYIPSSISGGLHTGRNVLAVRVNNSACCNSYFDMQVSTSLIRPSLCRLPIGLSPDAILSGSIDPGQEKTFFFENPIRRLLRFILNWPGSRLRLVLLQPDGTKYGEYQGSVPPIDVSIPEAEPGNWSARVSGIEVPQDNYLFSLVVATESATTTTATTTSTTILAAECGDGVTNAGEQCDDRNIVDGDCCSSACQFETGNCDDGNACTSAGVCSGGTCQPGTPLDLAAVAGSLAGASQTPDACTGKRDRRLSRKVTSLIASAQKTLTKAAKATKEKKQQKLTRAAVQKVDKAQKKASKLSSKLSAECRAALLGQVEVAGAQVGCVQ